MTTTDSHPRQTTVVLVDDSEDYRALTRLHLERDGRFRIVGEAQDGAEGLCVVGEQEPDLVVLDVTMPVMNGVQALPRMREQSPEVVIVMFSSLPLHQLDAFDFSTPPDAAIQKSGSFATFPEQLHRLVSDAIDARTPSVPSSTDGDTDLRS